MTTLQERLEAGQVIILDGAMGTELQRRGVPMHGAVWSGTAVLTHPDTVREAHEDYVRAGADIITTNSFATARHMLERAGLGEQVREANTRSVTLALEARKRALGARPVLIAGAISSMSPPVKGLEASCREQAELLAEAGVDLLLLEMMSDIENTSSAVRAAVATGLPTWVGFSCTIARDDSTVMLLNGTETLAQGLEHVMPLGGSLVAVMHTFTEHTTPALRVVMEGWSGPVGVYPRSGEFEMPHRQFENIIAPKAYLAEAKRWVEMGTQLVGGCCGIGPDHIRLLREELPTQIPEPRTS